MSDWLRKLSLHDWTLHCLDGYPGWDTEGKAPPFAQLDHVVGAGPSSHQLASWWDDVAEKGFYQRDWTDSATPFVTAGETYHSGWWFESAVERDRFLCWARDRLA